MEYISDEAFFSDDPHRIVKQHPDVCTISVTVSLATIAKAVDPGVFKQEELNQDWLAFCHKARDWLTDWADAIASLRHFRHFHLDAAKLLELLSPTEELELARKLMPLPSCGWCLSLGKATTGRIPGVHQQMDPKLFWRLHHARRDDYKIALPLSCRYHLSNGREKLSVYRGLKHECQADS